MRAVLDTNILISGLFWRGSPYRCLQAAEAGIYELIISDPIVRELEAVLAAKFSLTDAEVEKSVKLILKIGRKVRISTKLRVVTDDPDDDKFIETAMAGGADFIVSGDRHLLRLHEYKGVQIVKAGDFLELTFQG